MAMEILSGTIDAAEPVSSKRGFMMFKALQFHDRGGGERTLEKICCGGEVAGLVRKGGTGRYYLSSGGGQAGIHGVRLDDGTSAYAHFNSIELMVTIGLAITLGGLVLGMVNGGIMILPLVAAAVLVAIYAVLRTSRSRSKRQYDADGVTAG